METRSRPNPHPAVARLRLKGYTLASFAARYGHNPRTVKAAIREERNGPKSQQIRAQIARLTRHAA